MSMVLAIWKVHFKALYNGLRGDGRVRATWLIALVLDFGVGVWSVNAMIARLIQWQAAGSVAVVSGLWLVCLIGWAGIGLFGVVGTLQLGFGNLGMGSDTSLLLMTLPIASASRFWALYGLMFMDGIGNWLLLEMGIIGVAVIRVLGWQGLIWVVLLLAGMGVFVWCSMVVTLVVMRYVVPHVRRVLWVVFVVVLGMIFVGILVHFWGFAVMGHQTVVKLLDLLPVLLTLHSPGLSVALLSVLLVVLVGSLGNWVGELYVGAFHVLEGRVGYRGVLTLPGVPAVASVIGGYRSLTGALLYKGLLNQGRHVFTWGRLIIVLVGLLMFPVMRNLFVHYAFSGVFVVAGYSSILAVLTIMELAPHAISSEGNRLGLYLVASLRVGDILRARLVVFLSAALLVGLVTCGVLSWEMGLSGGEVFGVMAILILILVGYTGFVVCGSVFDEDLNLAVEGKMEVLFQEELPFTPRRMQFLGLSLTLLGLMLFGVWKLDVAMAIGGLVVLDGVMLIGMWHLSCVRMGRSLRKG